MVTESSLLLLQVSATCPYPEPDQSSPCSLSHFLKIHLVPKLIPPFPLLGLHKRINPEPRQMYWLCSKASIDGEDMLATRKNHKMEYHPLPAVGDWFFNIFAASLHTGRRFSNGNPRTHHAVMTGTHMSWYGQTLGGPTNSLIHWKSEAPSPGVRRRVRAFSHSHPCNTKAMSPWS